uniref:NADH-ubiquinone oxidoreductase chain 5 n=1 Tax=Anaulaciulus koreanus TaxID=1977246 RepID=A0A1X8VJ07_9MYRI|nr:NADH dehydrogenase subunit 5 [Anaulaciulus koreanus]ARF02897.1 NADH dehydrogenase subunit 5 [Anaulaciulus koreanus]
MIWPLKMSEISASIVALVGLISFILGMNLLILQENYLLEWNIFTFNSVNMKGILLFDWMAMIFMAVVLIISSSVLYYSGAYMSGEINMNRFLLLVLLFITSMILTILSPNFISILLGWDGLSLVSYCLVIFYQNNKAYNAGMITIMSNRVGDIGLLISIGWCMSLGEWNFFLLLINDKNMQWWVILCVLMAGLTKSAQLPYSAWLPAAMAAPTPVSALVHSSTLVTAGVYILIRFHSILEENFMFMQTLFYLSLMTSLMAGLAANFEYDFKKIIALSTLSQLGLMMSAVAMGAFMFAFYHLLIHALFKALMFLCAGKMIHSMGGYQDIRLMGSMNMLLPVSSICFNVANLALCGIPFLAGFYTKDMILELSFYFNMNSMSMIMFMSTTMLTCLYSFRVMWWTTAVNYQYFTLNSCEDWSITYNLPLIMLTISAVLAGAAMSWYLIISPNVMILYFSMKMIPQFMIIIAFTIGVIMFILMLNEKLLVSKFNSSMWFTPFISTQWIIKQGLLSGVKIHQQGDMGWGETMGAQGLRQYLLMNSELGQNMQNNNIKMFLFIFLIWMLIILMLI